jgi:hypothetical protein
MSLIKVLRSVTRDMKYIMKTVVNKATMIGATPNRTLK